MQPLSVLNIESELSYAYLHAIAADAGASCKPAGRHEDNNGVDADLTLWGPFHNGGYLEEVSIRVQLKATTVAPREVDGAYSYFLARNDRYDDLRCDAIALPRILVVLFLPRDRQQWISHSVDELRLRRCAYWVSLRGAGPSSNATGITVRLPLSQCFNAAALKGLAARLSRIEIPSYQES